jgi:hypothetical protein
VGIKTYLSKTLEASVVVDGGVMNKNYRTEENKGNMVSLQAGGCAREIFLTACMVRQV